MSKFTQVSNTVSKDINKDISFLPAPLMQTRGSSFNRSVRTPRHETNGCVRSRVPRAHEDKDEDDPSNSITSALTGASLREMRRNCSIDFCFG